MQIFIGSKYKENNNSITKEEANVYPNEPYIEWEHPILKQVLNSSQSRLRYAWLEGNMEKTSINKINKWGLWGNGQVNENPTPKTVVVSFFHWTNEVYLREVHLTQSKADQKEINNWENNTEHLICSEAISVENILYVRLYTKIIENTLIIIP